MDSFLSMNFSIPTAFVTAGFVYAMVSVAAWLMLKNQGAGAPTLWCLGGVVMGAGVLLVGLRGLTPGWLIYLVGNNLLVVGNLLHVVALRREIRKPLPTLGGVLAYAGVMLPFAYWLMVSPNPDLRFSWNVLGLGALIGWTSWLAWQMAREEHSKSAYWLAAFYAILTLELASRGLMTLTGLSTSHLLQNSFENIRVTINVLLVGVLGNMAIIGLYLERASRRNIQFAVEKERQTVLARLGEQIQQSNLERSLHELSLLLAHELSQPITAVMLNADMLQSRLDQLSLHDESAREQLASLQKQVLRSRSIIEVVRELAQSEDSQLDKLDLCSVLRDVMQLYAPQVQEGKVRFELTASPAQAWALGNAVLLSLVFHNLFRNAIQASRSGQTELQLSITQEASHWQVRVEDRGPGFSDAALAQVGNRRFSTKSDGMGVGLVLCQRIAKQHQGTLRWGNRISGQGASVQLRVMRADGGC